jgi:hypothetical protein
MEREKEKWNCRILRSWGMFSFGRVQDLWFVAYLKYGVVRCIDNISEIEADGVYVIDIRISNSFHVSWIQLTFTLI